MKLLNAKKICNSIILVRMEDGTTRCRFLTGNSMCRLPTKFRCDVVAYMERQKNKEKEQEPSSYITNLYGNDRTWSFSRFALLLKCPKAFKYHYYDKIEPEPKPYFWLGSQFHTAMAKIVSGRGEWSLEKPPDYVPADEVIKLKAFLEVASQRPWPAGDQEVHFEFEIDEGLLLQGFIDYISKDGRTIVERKYAQDAKDYHLLSLYYQLSSYLIAKPSVEQITIEVTRKSRLRRGKNETLDSFFARVLKDNQEHESELFTRRTYLRSEFDLDRVRKEFSLLARVATQYWRLDLWPMNASPHTCGNCLYYRHCRSRFGLEDESEEDHPNGD